MVDGSKFSDVDTVPSNPEIVSLGEKNLSSVSLLSTISESLVKRHTNPSPVLRSPIIRSPIMRSPIVRSPLLIDLRF